MHKFQPVLELLRTKTAADIHDAFVDSSGPEKGIGLERFGSVLKNTLGLDAKESDIKHLFCQIDRYSKNAITSTELKTYLNHYEKKREVPYEGPFQFSPTVYSGVRCQDSFVDWMLHPEDPDFPNEIADHYVSLSRSGFITVWTKDFKRRFETTTNAYDDAVPSKTTIWSTSLTCIPQEKLLAVATTIGDIRFYRSSTYKFEPKFSITNLPSIVLHINCYSSERLVCGDFSGAVFTICLGKTFFTHNHRRASHLPPEKISFDNLKMGRITGLAFEGTSKLHCSPVKQVEFIPSLEAVISCSANTKRSMLIHFLDNNESLGFRSEGGINCFTFYKRLNYVATGCVDHTVKIWNPLVNTSFSEALTGHTSPVNNVLVDESRMFLISADSGKVVRIWDLLRPKCLQVIKLKNEFPEKNNFSTAFLDPTNGMLILTTHRIGTLKPYQRDPRVKTHTDSEFLILAAYSGVFNSLVTVGVGASIAVWNADTGSLIYEFEKTHEVLDCDGLPQNMSIMSAGLDPSQRRLVTGDRVGTIKVWNFHLGLCLQTFQVGFIVLSLTFVGYDIYASGSTGVVVCLLDNGSETAASEAWGKCHKKSIVSLDCYRSSLLASASCDGEIVVWLRKSVDPKFHLKDLKEDEGDGNDSKSSRDGSEYLAEVRRRRRSSISQIIFLQKRELDFTIGNMVSCGMDGRVRFWNIVCTNKVNQGKLMSKFRAVFRHCDGVLCMATDSENRYLLTGDTMGYVRIYELDGYYSVYGSAPPRSKEAPAELLAKFPFLKMQRKVAEKHPEHSKFSKDGGSEVGFVPFLLNCFRAHLRAVQRIGYVDERELLITAGRDVSVRLWSLSGVYVGCLGPVDSPWNKNVAEQRITHRNYKPNDLKLAASAMTLFVLNSGNTPYWSHALETLRRCRLGHQPEGVSEQQFKWTSKQLAQTKESPEYGTLEEELKKRLPYFRSTKDCKQRYFQNYEDEF